MPWRDLAGADMRQPQGANLTPGASGIKSLREGLTIEAFDGLEKYIREVDADVSGEAFNRGLRRLDIGVKQPGLLSPLRSQGKQLAPPVLRVWLRLNQVDLFQARNALCNHLMRLAQRAGYICQRNSGMLVEVRKRR